MSGALNVARLTLHVGDFERRTRNLTPASLGAYVRLVMAYWSRGGPLPLDHGQLARIAGLPPADWRRRHAAAVLALFEVIDGHLWCEWLELALLERRARKLKPNRVEDQRLAATAGENKGLPGIICQARSAKKSSNINGRPVENRPPARTPIPKNQNPSCSLGDSDSAAIAAARPGATNQGPGRGSGQRSPPEPAQRTVVDLAERLRRELGTQAKPPAPSRSKGGMQQLDAVLARFGATVARRQLE